MMGAKEPPTGDEQGRIHPVTVPGGVKVMSFGFIVDPDQPVIWRGPMLQKALEQFFGDVLWGDLDDLVVDLPPGTGDVALTLCQQVPMAGVIIVTTPQDVALIDARKGLHMFRKLGVPVLGIVENMSFYECTECGHIEHIFGAGGGERTAEALEIPFLGSIPIDPAIVTGGDAGSPVVLDSPLVALRNGICLLPGDRKRLGLHLEFDLAKNIEAVTGEQLRAVGSSVFRRGNATIGTLYAPVAAQPEEQG